MKIGDRVQTPVGTGIIVAEEFPHAHYARWVVALDPGHKCITGTAAFYKEYKEVKPLITETNGSN